MACSLRSESECQLLDVIQHQATMSQMIRQHVREIKDVSGQFIEDVDVIIDKCENDHYVIMVLSELVRKLP